MIEIKCTEKQKRMIINALREADGCASIVETECAGGYCSDCIERNIKWDIQPEPLKPCPCCGGEAEYTTFENNTYAYCKSCHLQTITYESETQVAKVWNRRVTS
ncbi:MAG: Lar family restriction alleviation protein [Clostridia bacterium]|nr:Lar family restriction alleviation protein [Clostridia bacterium]